MKFFNTAGPVNADDHYILDPLHRWDLDEILMLIDQKKYFLLHAPRQTGKTSSLLALQKYLNERDDYNAVYVNVESGQAARNNIDQGVKAILSELGLEAEGPLDDDRISLELMEIFKQFGGGNALRRAFAYLDQLSDKLKEERVRRVIEPMLVGVDAEVGNDDQQYCADLGLIKKTKTGLAISNAIYREVLPRELTNPIQTRALAKFSPEWINDDQSLNVNKLMTMFQQFWRENSDIWSADIVGYKEAAPHLIFQGFMQRVGNGHGMIEREYALGRGRTDLYLRWKSPAGEQRVVFELKIRTERQNTPDALERIKSEGIAQTVEYADKCGAKDAHLIIFDRRKNIDWSEKIYNEVRGCEGFKVFIWGM